MAEQEKPQTIETMTSEDIALLILQEYEKLLMVQNNLRILRQEVDTRKLRYETAKKDLTNDNGSK